ncbi:13691_t:CDS:2 [Cetraspora pellucida]|uniref:13691_t:CDS:1 n=1 Tax=Cetraspora pellucida TaxID=1433469 RepID=A0A9N9FGZ5_9GLOM|nr:13691_t:CDS:2 [Cetraspora pellucida]
MCKVTLLALDYPNTIFKYQFVIFNFPPKLFVIQWVVPTVIKIEPQAIYPYQSIIARITSLLADESNEQLMGSLFEQQVEKGDKADVQIGLALNLDWYTPYSQLEVLENFNHQIYIQQIKTRTYHYLSQELLLSLNSIAQTKIEKTGTLSHYNFIVQKALDFHAMLGGLINHIVTGLEQFPDHFIGPFHEIILSTKIIRFLLKYYSNIYMNYSFYTENQVPKSEQSILVSSTACRATALRLGDETYTNKVTLSTLSISIIGLTQTVNEVKSILTTSDNEFITFIQCLTNKHGIKIQRIKDTLITTTVLENFSASTSVLQTTVNSILSYIQNHNDNNNVLNTTHNSLCAVTTANPILTSKIHNKMQFFNGFEDLEDSESQILNHRYIYDFDLGPKNRKNKRITQNYINLFIREFDA